MVNLCRFKNGEFTFGFNKEVTQNTLVSFAIGTVELTRITAWVRKKWLSMHRLIPGEKNAINEPLVYRKKHHPSTTAHQTRYHETVY